jgi:recombinational DNA repair protein RecR
MNANKSTLTYKILLKTTDNAVRFVNTINSIDGYFDICMGCNFFDAKSMLGVLSMDPRREMTLRVVRNDHSFEELNSKLQPFCV